MAAGLRLLWLKLLCDKATMSYRQQQRGLVRGRINDRRFDWPHPGEYRARERTRLRIVWFYGAALFIVALPHSLLMKADRVGLERKQLSEGLKKCPHCAEFIKIDANVCRYCGRDLNSYVEPLPDMSRWSKRDRDARLAQYEAVIRAANVEKHSTSQQKQLAPRARPIPYSADPHYQRDTRRGIIALTLILCALISLGIYARARGAARTARLEMTASYFLPTRP
ncbi:zinc ribbon domain-containing protein [Mesorhizobium sp. LjNodule214]|uniref:zinc ribbon domain-containing protein n=1 Tax=Mesorhizobium sp. LjNodule214 TaxID=3342252 RepID=UPI003F506847